MTSVAVPDHRSAVPNDGGLDTEAFLKAVQMLREAIDNAQIKNEKQPPEGQR